MNEWGQFERQMVQQAAEALTVIADHLKEQIAYIDKLAQEIESLTAGVDTLNDILASAQRSNGSGSAFDINIVQ